jgi:hypothetical protein
MWRFSIRDLLWLTALAALAACWWKQYQSHEADRRWLNTLAAEHQQLRRDHSELNLQLIRGGFFATQIDGQRVVSRVYP